MHTDEQLKEIIETYINGNISTAKEALYKLTVTEALRLIEIAQGQYGIKRHIMSAFIISAHDNA